MLIRHAFCTLAAALAVAMATFVAPSAHGNATVARIDTHSAIVSSRASALTRLVYHKGDR